MRVISWDIVLLFFMIGYAAQGYSVISCDRTITIRCNTYKIVVMKLTASPSLGAHLLEKCNGHQMCIVNNANNECLDMAYWCQKEVHTVEIAELHDYHLNSQVSAISLMSESYINGQYIKAQHTICNLKLAEGNNTFRAMKVTVNEFAPYTNSSDFCLHVKGAPEPPVCSGLQKIYVPYKPVRSTDGWQISMKLAETATQVPDVRFWISIDISPKDESVYHLECRSHPARGGEALASFTEQTITNVTNNEGLPANMIIAAVLGTLFLGTILICSVKKIKCSKETSSLKDNPTDVDEGDLGCKGETVREKQTITIANEEVPLSKSFELLPIFSIQDRKLPSLPGSQRSLSKADADDEYIPPRSMPDDVEDDDGSPRREEIYPDRNDRTHDVSHGAIADTKDLEDAKAMKESYREESENEGEECVIENEYMSLSQETLTEVVETPSSSTGSTYTLLDGQRRTDEMSDKGCDESKSDRDKMGCDRDAEMEHEDGANKLSGETAEGKEVDQPQESQTQGKEDEPKCLVKDKDDVENKEELEDKEVEGNVVEDQATVVACIKPGK